MKHMPSSRGEEESRHDEDPGRFGVRVTRRRDAPLGAQYAEERHAEWQLGRAAVVVQRRARWAPLRHRGHRLSTAIVGEDKRLRARPLV